MHTHPHWRPYEQIDLQTLDAVRVAPAESTSIEVVPPDPEWPAQYEVVRQRVLAALGDRALSVEHIGSTASAPAPTCT